MPKMCLSRDVEQKAYIWRIVCGIEFDQCWHTWLQSFKLCLVSCCSYSIFSVAANAYYSNNKYD